MDLLGYNIDTDLPSFPIYSKTIISTINPHSFCVAKKDTDFESALTNSDYLIPDGIGIVFAAKVIKNKKISRISGSDMHKYLLEQAQINKLKVFYLGAQESTLNKICERVVKEYPSIRVSSFSPPFKQIFSEDDNHKMQEVVNQFSPDILFVGMTAPKQEKWVFANKNKLEVNIITSIGAVFDFFSGTVKRAPNWIIYLGLEWLYRFASEPRRMWRRYLVNNIIFLFYIFEHKFFNIKK